MTYSTSPLGYDDCFGVMDEALQNEIGIRMCLPDEKTAQRFRARCHQARVINRKQNTEIFEKSHPMYGLSQYDRLVIRIAIEKSIVWVYFEKSRGVPGRIEKLSPNDAVEELLPPPSVTVTAPTDDEIGDAFDKIIPVDGADHG